MNNFTGFMDLEPILGTSDHIWEDMIREIDLYPYKFDLPFLVKNDKDDAATNTTKKAFLRKNIALHKERLEQTDAERVLSKNFHIPESWTNQWDTYINSTKVIMVQLNMRHRTFLPGHRNELIISYFPKTWDYINTLPIKEIYDAMIINGDPHTPIYPHYDWQTFNPYKEQKIHMLVINPINNFAFYYKKSERKIFMNSSLFLMDNSSLEHGVAAESHKTSIVRLYCALEDEFCEKHNIYKIIK